MYDWKKQKPGVESDVIDSLNRRLGMLNSQFYPAPVNMLPRQNLLEADCSTVNKSKRVRFVGLLNVQDCLYHAFLYIENEPKNVETVAAGLSHVME